MTPYPHRSITVQKPRTQRPAMLASQAMIDKTPECTARARWLSNTRPALGAVQPPSIAHSHPTAAPAAQTPLQPKSDRRLGDLPGPAAPAACQTPGFASKNPPKPHAQRLPAAAAIAVFLLTRRLISVKKNNAVACCRGRDSIPTRPAEHVPCRGAPTWIGKEPPCVGMSSRCGFDRARWAAPPGCRAFRRGRKRFHGRLVSNSRQPRMFRAHLFVQLAKGLLCHAE